MPLDLTGLTRIGNMTAGGGLSAIFDGTATTTGYAQSTTGYCGVDFNTAPKKIDKVEIVSATNGFDASGSTSQITLQLYGKNSSAPINATDGTLLGSLGPFTDINSQQTKTIASTDTATDWRYVWVRVATGVWSIASELRMFELDTVVEPAASNARVAVYSKSCDEAVALTWNASEISPFRITLQMNAPAVADIVFQANTVHRGDITGFNGVLSVGFNVEFRYATTYAGLTSATWARVPNAVSGCNICERDPHHYGAATIVATMQGEVGFYQFRITGSARSTASNLDGLAAMLVEGGAGLNRLRIAFDKDAELMAA